jgi:uncharacterized Ntn-hydrolase superfamily protein
MTFSLLALEPHTGRIGLATTTSDLAVGARVLAGAAGVGGAVTQHTTDPRLGTRGVALLADGNDPRQTIDLLVASAVCAPARQLAVIDARGRTAVWDGAYVDAERAYSVALDGLAVTGNVLSSPSVGEAIADAFRASADLDLAERLVEALRAGERAGGEGVPLVSAALRVYDVESFPYVDLRIDHSADPLADLADLNRRYTARRDEYVRRAIDPDVSYAFPGEEPA